MKPISEVLITGGSGFIGQAVVAECVKRGIYARVFDRVTGGDVRDAMAVDDAAHGAQAVIHLAGVLGTAELFDDAERAIDVNVKGALNVLQACRRHGAGFVGISMPDCWANVYQATKGCAKRLATAWHQNFGVPVSHVRAFNAYGPGQKWGPGHPQKIVPTFATLAWQGKPLPVWGDGSQTVDMVHSGDIARMLVDATGYGDDQTFDAGTGQAKTVLGIARKILEIAGVDGIDAIEFLPMRAGETPTTLTCATGQGWDVLGWCPDWSEERFREVVEGYRQEALAAVA